ncbi:unnamed protein product, partial [Rotaria magnacalcarata]
FEDVHESAYYEILDDQPVCPHVKGFLPNQINLSITFTGTFVTAATPLLFTEQSLGTS